MNMVEKKEWKEFIDSGLLWWINMILHTFGWAITYTIEDGKVKEVYPARVKFRGFSEEISSEGYVKVSEYIKENADTLKKRLRNRWANGKKDTQRKQVIMIVW